MKYLAFILLFIPFNNFSQSEFAVGDTISLNNFQFSSSYQGKYGNMTLEPLQGITQLMLDNPDMSIQIEAHFNTQGNKDRSREDSKDQARMMRDYLVENGVEATRISAQGYGEDRPIYTSRYINQIKKSNPEKCSEMHAANERALFIVTEM